MERVISLLGLVVMMGLAWAMSEHKKQVSLRVVWGGLLLQLVLALFILKTSIGAAIFQSIGDFFTATLGFVDAGTSLVFGEEYVHHFFAFKVLPTIIFFSSLMSILYYLGIIQKVVEAFAYVMRRTLGTSGSETLSAAANIFVGQTEAPLMVRPYISSMTKSELMALMVGGFATIAGGVLVAYAGMGIDAGHLVAASVISAPAALLISKLMIPETEQSVTLGHVELSVDEKHANIVDAATNGALDGMKLTLVVANVVAMLIAFLALVALVDAILGLIGEWTGALLGYNCWYFDLKKRGWLTFIVGYSNFLAAVPTKRRRLRNRSKGRYVKNLCTICLSAGHSVVRLLLCRRELLGRGQEGTKINGNKNRYAECSTNLSPMHK